ncbi:hypothetical protein [Sphingobacterium sp. DR205]|uniref:hypothetical protein n=1 Tax=Sphingobacterium sp. DR205 TaxID=2713573 RepID=UPI0013E4752F|nr:hypothetical protein [Sphingobacterium sp. DR205]QIH32630.1 hypothetical protein G6053_06855 [Sphingobacterium sp. DR205]
MKGMAQMESFYHVTPMAIEGYFTKTIFPFNPTFIKAKKVKSITVKSRENGIFNCYTFNSNGLLMSISMTRYDQEKKDTVFYTTYSYQANGFIAKEARIDYHSGIVKIKVYGYDEKNRIDNIRIFSLNAQMPNQTQNNDWMGEPVAGVDQLILKGSWPEEKLLNNMIRENKFSSWQYRYYTENKFEVEERTEFFDFMKNGGSQDTCYQKITYYHLNNHPIAQFLHFGCAAKTIPSEQYEFKEGLLSEIHETDADVAAKSEKYSYDKNRNLLSMQNIRNGQKVSELIMTYNQKGFLTTIQRKSETAKMAQYFEDRILDLSYTFY